jgi:hypothetical protein
MRTVTVNFPEKEEGLFGKGIENVRSDILFVAAELGKACYAAGCSVEEVRGCVRHLVV